MKRKENARIISQTELCENIFDLRIETALAREAHAGQFIGIYTSDKSKLLPRPISICEVTDYGLRFVYRVTGTDTGTENISRLRQGDEVSILGILGNGYDVSYIASHYRYPVLMGGGIGIPPMLELAKELRAAYVDMDGEGHLSSVVPDNDSYVTAILGYRDEHTFLADEFETISRLYIATEDGSVGTHGNVLDVMADESLSCDVILACGPAPMLKAIARFAGEHDIKAYVSLEERMACGVGACLGCITATQSVDEHSHVRNARVCTDGPVFDAAEIYG